MVFAGVCFGCKGCDCTSSTKLLCLQHRPCSFQFCRRLHSAAVRWIHLPARWHASIHSLWHVELAVDQMSRLYYQKLVVCEFTGPKPSGLPCLGGNIGGLSQAASKAKNVELKERSFKSDRRLVLKLVVHTLNIHSDCRILTPCCYHFNYVILLCICFNVFERAKISRWHC